jgi:hypothetical protein
LIFTFGELPPQSPPPSDLPVIDFHLCLEVATRVITCSNTKLVHQIGTGNARLIGKNGFENANLSPRCLFSPGRSSL